MNINEILRLIREELGEEEINEILLAALRGFERVHPEGELLFLALPKGDKEERKRIMDAASAWVEQ